MPGRSNFRRASGDFEGFSQSRASAPARHPGRTIRRRPLAPKSYRVLAQRYQVSGGEIDIVARRGDTIAFVEVKVRPTLDEARTAIDFVKRRRAAKTWLATNPWAAPLTWRGDAVYIAPWRWPRHEIAAFGLDLG